MNDQGYDDPGAQVSQKPDSDAGIADEGAAAAGPRSSATPAEEDDTSREADVGATDKHAGDAGYDDRRLGLR